MKIYQKPKKPAYYLLHRYTLQAAVLAVIILGLGTWGWYAWQVSQSVNATYDAANLAWSTTLPHGDLKGICTLGQSTLGRRFVDETYGFSFCVPDGWQLFRYAGYNYGIVGGIQAGLVYKANTTPKVFTPNKGWDGVTPFGLQFNETSGSWAGYAKIGTFKAGSLLGTIYRQTQTSNGGPSALPSGTVTTAYDLVKGSNELTMTYEREPGTADLSATMAQLAQTLAF